MYTPVHFAETRREILHDLVAAHPLGTLVTLTPTGLDANHLPFELDPEPKPGAPHGTLRAHVARANPGWRDFRADVDVRVIFQGPQAYITPTWYTETKPASGKVVPTWNYCVVHAHGPLRVHDEGEWVRHQVEALLRRHEAAQEKPWHVSDAPVDYIEKQLAAIVGIEIPLIRLVGKWKVSQNRSAADRAGVAAGLNAAGVSDAPTMARLVHDQGVPPARVP